jgi:hypothetical protein
LHLRIVSRALHQWSVQRPGWLGVVLHERLHGRYDLPIEHEPSDVRRGGQWLHRCDHLDLLRLHRCGRLGIVLH